MTPPDATPPDAALWATLAPRDRGLVAAHVVAVIAGGLWLEAVLGWTGQHLATAWTLGVFAWLFRLGGRAERRALLVCTGLAAFGEAVLALGWGVYTYRFGNLPLFVPPGHALLMTLGLVVRPHMTPRAVRGIAAAAAAWALAAVATRNDEFGAALAVLFLACTALSRGRDLYAAMLVLALVMELYGTALGSWTWAAIVPGTARTAANPPFAAGAFYCLLDLLVLAAVRPAGQRSFTFSSRTALSSVRD